MVPAGVVQRQGQARPRTGRGQRGSVRKSSTVTGSCRRIASTHGPRPRRYCARSKAPIRAWLAANVVGVPSWKRLTLAPSQPATPCQARRATSSSARASSPSNG